MHENEKYFNEQIFQCGLQKMDSVIGEVLDNYVERCETDAGTGGITSGFKELDECTDGWMPGDMIILSSFAGMGLTSFALNLAVNAHNAHHIPILYFSMGQKAADIARRLLTIAADLPTHAISRGEELSPVDLERLEEVCRDLKESPIFIDDTPRIEYNKLSKKIQEAMQENDIALVIVDNINIMQPPAIYQGMREQEISAISRELKFVARELSIPIIALAELNRQSRGRSYSSYSSPRLEDLKESGALEYDADVILFLCEETRGLSESFLDDYKIRLAKNRRGRTWDIDIHYDRTTGKMTEVVHEIIQSAMTFEDVSDEPSDTPTEENPKDNEF
jgi:replicative DNA helicase